MKKLLILCWCFPLLSLACMQPASKNPKKAVNAGNGPDTNAKILTGAAQTAKYLPLLKGKKVGLVINQTAEINGVSLVDTLKNLGVNIQTIFGPEHGFRGMADAGEKVGNYTDKKSGVQVVSLYGGKHAPDAEDLKNLDLILFDIQDVGVRFYTYTITLADVMEACALHHKPLIVLDRPNPNGKLIDGPILKKELQSGVGRHPIPIGHGLTIGEFARMANGEKWLKDGIKCDLTVIPLKNYRHELPYELPVKPSPNLPNALSVALYPSLCLFEGTVISQGRGTYFPFQVLGHPAYKNLFSFSFTPQGIAGMSKNPPLENQVCYGIDFRNQKINDISASGKLNLQLLLELYQKFPDKNHFFLTFFNKLAGTEELMSQIKAGKTEAEIRKSWEKGLKDYKEIRKKYLLYQ